jgi:hypothetical protein
MRKIRIMGRADIKIATTKLDFIRNGPLKEKGNDVFVRIELCTQQRSIYFAFHSASVH